MVDDICFIGKWELNMLRPKVASRGFNIEDLSQNAKTSCSRFSAVLVFDLACHVGNGVNRERANVSQNR